MTVVVGVDNFVASRAALRIAAQEARRRQAPLVAVTAYDPRGACPAHRAGGPGRQADRPGIEPMTSMKRPSAAPADPRQELTVLMMCRRGARASVKVAGERTAA
jgi:Universal stress protein family